MLSSIYDWLSYTIVKNSSLGINRQLVVIWCFSVVMLTLYGRVVIWSIVLIILNDFRHTVVYIQTYSRTTLEVII